VVEGEEIVVRGKTDKGAQVTLNDQNIFVDTDGLFSDKLFLRAGMNTITVRTLNRFDKEKTATVTIESRRPVLEVVPQIESIPPPIEPTN
jgi:GTPase Era involved in 16S rRNA processing